MAKIQHGVKPDIFKYAEAPPPLQPSTKPPLREGSWTPPGDVRESEPSHRDPVSAAIIRGEHDHGMKFANLVTHH